MLKQAMHLIKHKKWIILAICFLVWFFFSGQPALTEQFYSRGIYPYTALIQRAITRWLPVSMGDFLYAVLICWIIYKLFIFFKEKKYKQSIFKHLLYVFKLLATGWILFQYIWGLNYYRAGIASQTQLIPAPYNSDTLTQLTRYLINKVNLESNTLGSTYQFPSWETMQHRCIDAYDSAEQKYPFLHYTASSVKKSLYGRLGNYVGFLGYYNPFSGEAQLNRFIPDAVKPFTICHEIAHQVGYASESEASFVAYLTCMESDDLMLQYSAHFDVLLYAWGELYYRDSTAAKTLMKMVNETVKSDWKIYRNYVNAYQNPIEPVMNSLYSFFLKANNQEAGIESYDEVVAWVNAFEARKQKPYQ